MRYKPSQISYKPENKLKHNPLVWLIEQLFQYATYTMYIGHCYI